MDTEGAIHHGLEARYRVGEQVRRGLGQEMKGTKVQQDEESWRKGKKRKVGVLQGARLRAGPQAQILVQGTRPDSSPGFL